MDHSKALGDVIHSFAVKLYQFIEDSIDTKENIVISPISVFNALFMACLGTRGSTRVECEQVLNLSVSDPVWRERMAELQKNFMKPSGRTGQNEAYSLLPYMPFQLPDTKENVVKNIFNGVVISKYFKVREEFLRSTASVLQASIEETDFSNFETFRQQFNQHISDLTGGAIKNALAADSIMSDTAVLFTNTLYFKGPWLVTFRIASVAPFFIDAQHSIEVPMMENWDYIEMGVFRDLDASTIFLPYKDRRHGLLILLPETFSNIKETQSRLLALGYTSRKLLQHMRGKKLVIKLPKFKIQFKKELNDILQKMGFCALVSSFGDYSGINEDLDPTFDKIIKFAHQSVIELNEYGTEAAAFTSVAMIPASTESHSEFTVNRPFLYYLIDRENDAIPLFMGRVVNPLSR